MIFEELLPMDWPRREVIPDVARDRQIADRNRAGLRLWYVRTFGDEVGEQLFADSQRLGRCPQRPLDSP